MNDKYEFIITQEDPETDDANMLLQQLSDTLENITSSSGKNSFDVNDVKVPRSIFIVVRDKNGTAVGCGGFRPMNDEVAEIKRVYAKEKRKGIGSKIVSYLENQAKEMNYKAVQLETRVINKTAVSFYQTAGYHVIDNYGKYAERSESICFEKKLEVDVEEKI